MRVRIRYKRTGDEDNPYMVSISDLMSGLLVVFILATIVLVLQLTIIKRKALSELSDLQEAERTRIAVLHEIKKELADRSIIVEINENESIIHIDENTLSFQSNSDQLPQSEQAQRTVATIGEVLNNVITREDRLQQLNTIFIEGHTDSKFTTREKGNWRLSTFRAISVWQFWNERLNLPIPFSEMKNSGGQALFSVSGYAETRRVNTDESTDQLRRKNRRIDIRITVRNPTVKDYKDVLKKAF